MQISRPGHELINRDPRALSEGVEVIERCRLGSGVTRFRSEEENFPGDGLISPKCNRRPADSRGNESPRNPLTLPHGLHLCNLNGYRSFERFKVIRAGYCEERDPFNPLQPELSRWKCSAFFDGIQTRFFRTG